MDQKENRIREDLTRLMSEQGLSVDENQKLERYHFGFKMDVMTGIPYPSYVLRSTEDEFCVFTIETTDVFLARNKSNVLVEDLFLSDEMEIVRFINKFELDETFSPFSTLFVAAPDDPKFARLLNNLKI